MKSVFKKIIVEVLTLEAKLVLKKYRPKIIAITGSVGKTSTKDAIYTVLSTSFFTRKSSKSFNSEIGVPLTILGLPNAWNSPLGWSKNIIEGAKLLLFPHRYPKWLVLEVGADRPGDIESLAFWLKPDIAVVTRLSEVPVHVEFFSSPEQVRHEKLQLVLAAGKDSTVILNADDKLVSSLRPFAKGRVVTYGVQGTANIRGLDFDFTYDARNLPTGVSFKVEIGNEILPINMKGSLGRQHMYTSLVALSVAKILNLDLNTAVKSLANHDSPPGRMKILEGLNSSCIIDDSYNSSPVAANEALGTLKEIKTSGRKIIALGDMLELGRFSPNEHEKLGAKTVSVADIVYTVGVRSKGIFEAALRAGFPRENIFEFHDSVEAGESLKNIIRAGDIILVKGSQGVRMEKVVEKIMARPEKAHELLVRQEEEWKQRA